MKLFNRKNQQEEKLDELNKLITNQNELIQSLKNDQEEIKKTNKKLLSKIKQHESVLTNLESKILKIEKHNQEINTLQEKQETKINKLTNNIQEKLNDLTKNTKKEKPKNTTNKPKETKKHIRKFGESYKRKYTNIKLINNNVYVGNKQLQYTIEEIIKLQKKVPLTKTYPTIPSLFKDMEYNDYRSKVLIWNLEEGNFNKIIDEYNKNSKDINEDKHIRPIPSSLKKPLNNLKLSGEHIISKGHTLKYTINDVINIQKKIKDINKYPTVKSIYDTIPLSRNTTGVIIWNIEEGNYDALIEEYHNNPTPSSNYHIYKLSDSYKVPYKNLTVDNDGNIQNKVNQTLPFTIYDILEMKRRIYSGHNKNVTEIYSDLGFTHQLGNKLVWNIEESNFEDIIEEYTSRNYDYEKKYNRLYIDGEDTGLTIEKCKVIIDCIINEPNKAVTINKLIRTYNTVDPKYIRILGEEYNNINLDKILSHKVNKVEKVNNPQKRKEKGLL